MESVKDEMRRNLIAKIRIGRAALPRHPRLRRDGRPAGPERDPLAARHALPRPPRPGQDPDAPPARPPARRRDADRRRLGGQRPPLRPALAGGPRPRRRNGRRHADRLGRPRGTVSREARDARRDHRRPDRRDRHDQARRGPLPLERADDALRPDPPDQPGDLLHQRAARPLAQDPGRPVQRARGARRPDPRLSGPPEPRPLHGLLGQPRGLHQPRPDRHPAQGPDRLGRPHALSADPRARHRDQRPERLARTRPPRQPAGGPALHQGDRRGDLAAGAVVAARQPAVGRLGPDVDRQPRERGLERRAPRPAQPRALDRPAGLRPDARRPQLARQARADDDRGRRPRGQADRPDRRRGGQERLRPAPRRPRVPRDRSITSSRARRSRSATRCRPGGPRPDREGPRPPQAGRGARPPDPARPAPTPTPATPPPPAPPSSSSKGCTSTTSSTRPSRPARPRTSANSKS